MWCNSVGFVWGDVYLDIYVMAENIGITNTHLNTRNTAVFGEIYLAILIDFIRSPKVYSKLW